MNTVIQKFLRKKLIAWSKTDNHTVFLFLILFFAFLARIININYNSAFNDEAIYIVIGRMGLFVNDWWSYGAKLWMAGVPYIYPPISALAYQFGGLIGSRFLNVIFGILLVEEVYRLTRLLNLYDEKTNKLASLFATFLAAFSGIGIFVSKLAVYDMPSFLLFMIGINSFLKAKYFSNGKYYFIAFFCLFTAFLTKIVIAIFFPILFILSVFIIKDRSSGHKKKAIVYLYIPLIIGSILYFYLYKDNLMTYIVSHKDLGKTESYLEILSLIWQETKVLFILFIPSSFLLVASKKIKMVICLTLLSLTIPVFHLALLRLTTLDKHLYITVIFLSVIVGYGAGFAVLNKSKLLRLFTKVSLPIILAFYILSSYQVVSNHERGWKNTVALQNYLEQKIQPGDKVLTEEGGVVILALYDKIFPPKSIVTFDWINYSGLQTDQGYVKAVSDVYFDYIELNGSFEGKDSLNDQIRKSLADNYYLAYKKDSFEVYQKNEKY